MQGPEVRSGDLSEPIELIAGEEWTFTIKEGEMGAHRRISVNYDGFVDDVAVGDELLVDGGIMTFQLTGKTDTDVTAEVCAAGCSVLIFVNAVRRVPRTMTRSISAWSVHIQVHRLRGAAGC